MGYTFRNHVLWLRSHDAVKLNFRPCIFGHKISVLITDVQMPLINTHADVTSKFWSESLRLHPCFEYASSQGSYMYILADAISKEISYTGTNANFNMQSPIMKEQIIGIVYY